MGYFVKNEEHYLQMAVFAWGQGLSSKHPELLNLFAIPNGGHRHILTALKLKREGVQAGVPDLFLAVPNKKFHGLFIELKVNKNKLSLSQKNWHERLADAGYSVATCYTLDTAQKTIISYLKNETV